MSKWYPCIYCTEDLHCTKYTDSDHESWCVLGPCTDETPSHGDQIRRMSDEELAELIGDNIDCSICKKKIFNTTECPGAIAIGGDCYSIFLCWLKQEAKW